MVEQAFNEETFNLDIRKFLKKVGVTSQREIERVVREGLQSGKLRGDETLQAEMTLTIPALGLMYKVDGDISLG
jgi:hypothetical protein